MPAQPHLFDLDREQLQALVRDAGMQAFRAEQVLDWVYRKRVIDPNQMTNLSQADQTTLGEYVRFLTGRRVGHEVATDGVQKLLLQWDADAGEAPGAAPTQRHDAIVDDPARQTECVVIPAEGVTDREQRPRRTACVSSQIGCAVGCTFCASGLGGLDGNLTAGQIVEQVWQLGQLSQAARVNSSSLKPQVSQLPITNVVFMGMGEPLANFEQVTRAVRLLTAEWGLNLSGRRITISTVGLPAQMRRLADMGLPVTLALSLHAPNDELRRRLIPWARFVTIAQLLDAGRYYFDKTGREITLEYILLGGVNDQPQHARELATVAGSLRANVNLIRYNEVNGLPFQRPRSNDVHHFQSHLRRAGINAHIRASRGRDIAAACGQLRHEQTPAISPKLGTHT